MIQLLSQLMVISARRRMAAVVLLTTLLSVPLVCDDLASDRLLPEGPDPNVPLPIDGIVTFQGQTVADAVVSFLPVDDPGRRGAFGGTKADGSLRLSTFDFGDGALPGHYKVLVVKKRLLALTGTEALDVSEISPNGYWEQTGLLTTRQRYESLLPLIYGDPSRTPLRCRVPGEERVVLDLKVGE